MYIIPVGKGEVCINNEKTQDVVPELPKRWCLQGRVFLAVDIDHLLQTMLLHLQRHLGEVAGVFAQRPNMIFCCGQLCSHKAEQTVKIKASRRAVWSLGSDGSQRNHTWLRRKECSRYWLDRGSLEGLFKTARTLNHVGWHLHSTPSCNPAGNDRCEAVFPSPRYPRQDEHRD